MRALILIDIQNDFLPGGKLAITQSDEIFPIINELLSFPFNLIVATKDWHPIDHISFAANSQKEPGQKINTGNIEHILWPIHCVQETEGAELSSKLDISKISKIFHKGTDKYIDSYSIFFDNLHKKSTGLEDYLREHSVKDVYIAGLATDYCVKYSVLDAISLGFKTFVVADACRGVNLQNHDTDKALIDMKKAGARIITFKEIFKNI